MVHTILLKRDGRLLDELVDNLRVYGALWSVVLVQPTRIPRTVRAEWVQRVWQEQTNHQLVRHLDSPKAVMSTQGDQECAAIVVRCRIQAGAGGDWWKTAEPTQLSATLCGGQGPIFSVASVHLNAAVVLYLLISILGVVGGVGWSEVFFVVKLICERCF